MANSPLIEPFFLQFDREGIRYSAKITYAKSGSSCLNIFEVEMIQPPGHRSFTLQEKPVKTPDFEYMVWTDQDGKQKELYQLIGAEITDYMKNQLGIFLLDAPLNSQENDKDLY